MARTDATSESRAGKRKRANLGRFLVGLAVFAPAALVLGVYLVLQGKLYGYHFPYPLWPFITADVAVLLIGVAMMRGEDL